MSTNAKKIELLAPAGNPEKLKTALYFGADAVYLAGKNFSLRAQSDNFSDEELKEAITYAHTLGKKVYVALNIFAYDADFDALPDFIKYLESINADAVIVSDAGVFDIVKKTAPDLKIHISTQSNITNKYAAKFWAEQGAERIVLARELSLNQIRQIRDFLPGEVALEAFVHGAMCMSYSGRCLLSNYFTSRPSNRGECVQSCRWEYYITEKSRKGQDMQILEDERGTYILNSKDLNMIEHIDKLADAGIESFKIEGRVKTSYYVANTVNAYRRGIDVYSKNPQSFTLSKDLSDELYKSSHRLYCTGFYFGNENNQCLDTSKPSNGSTFCALVLQNVDGGILIEQRNRFYKGDTLEILSPSDLHNQKITIDYMADEAGNEITDALRVQQRLFIRTNFKLSSGDILRK